MKALTMLCRDKKWIEEECDISKIPIKRVQTTIKDLVEINEAIAELEALQQHKSCEWHLGDYDQNSWISKCGAEFILIEGIPSENGMNFCHKCGGKLIQIEPKEQ